ncbi:unnamed protein product [Cyprideis torosa]|uniref:Uncharacterized protein n=1 Tax=Cyprideis torosa TaxID=163714 RepID=A0A7R8ZNW6_9CRUS|nr:unnamed protein product [Cyprideis torosa]CAG0887311.1 unnamed protein product [Cyprideis torosa]
MVHSSRPLRGFESLHLLENIAVHQRIRVKNLDFIWDLKSSYRMRKELWTEKSCWDLGWLGRALGTKRVRVTVTPNNPVLFWYRDVSLAGDAAVLGARQAIHQDRREVTQRKADIIDLTDIRTAVDPLASGSPSSVDALNQRQRNGNDLIQYRKATWRGRPSRSSGVTMDAVDTCRLCLSTGRQGEPYALCTDETYHSGTCSYFVMGKKFSKSGVQRKKAHSNERKKAHSNESKRMD